MYPIKKRDVFKRLRTTDLRARNGSSRVNYVETDTPGPALAFVFARAFGSAVERNRARRRLKAAFMVIIGSETAPPIVKDGAFQLSGNQKLLTDPFTNIVADLNKSLSRLDDMKNSSPQANKK